MLAAALLVNRDVGVPLAPVPASRVGRHVKNDESRQRSIKCFDRRVIRFVGNALRAIQLEDGLCSRDKIRVATVRTG